MRRLAVDVPATDRGAEHGQVGVAVAVVVARDGDVAVEAARTAGPAVDVPAADGGPENGDLGVAVTVVVAGDGDVAAAPK